MKKHLLILLSLSLLNCATKVPLRPQKEFFAGVNDLSAHITDNLLEYEKEKIAVLPFLDLDGNTSDFGNFLSDEVADRLILTQKFRVVERAFLRNAIKKNSLTLEDVTASNSAKKLAGILKADALATGTYTVLDKTVRIRTRLIDVRSAEIFAVANMEIFLDNDTMKMLKLKKKPIGRWSQESEKAKQVAFDKHLKQALSNIKRASSLDNLITFDKDTEKLFYTTALAELEMAISIYPDDPRAQKMQQKISTLLGFASQ